ncbi:bacteriocin [Occultella glacieicola]|uniref:Type 1 encapsulin shell protein n=1 Tax=Occultella glacieicola TaxID=2518684 RepID=A0ABY2E3J3_9MICO|nr:family 1 encapsulin nanocompartment shell protein [Occultella glacieicola]TDE92690.1 bacteriocin [Occultella glacieicola]
MNHLLRSHAPISSAAWDQLDAEATERLTVALGARKLVDFSGPLGWEASATNLGRVGPVADTPAPGVIARSRRVLAMIEVRADFSVSRDELAAADRGAPDPDLTALDEAAVRIAEVENTAIMHGWTEAGITGITQASSHRALPHDPDATHYPQQVAAAVATLLRAGVAGPYGLALGPADYTEVIESAENGGYPLFDHLRKILQGGPIVWVPGLRGGTVMSMRGGDFLFTAGQDFAIGYSHHDSESVHLYLEESFTFQVATPEAAIELSDE